MNVCSLDCLLVETKKNMFYNFRKNNKDDNGRSSHTQNKRLPLDHRRNGKPVKYSYALPFTKSKPKAI